LLAFRELARRGYQSSEHAGDFVHEAVKHVSAEL
jgi:hypothetical protein